MRPARVFLGILLLASGSAACTALLGYGDPVEIAPVADAAATTPDAVADVVGADATEGGAAQAFCASLATKPTFCESFDGVEQDYLGGWQLPQQFSGNLSRDPQAWVSPPAALKATTGAWVLRDFPERTNQPLVVSLSLQLRIDTSGPSGNLAVLAEPLALGDTFGTPIYLLQLVARATSPTVATLGLTEINGLAAPAQHAVPGTIPQKQWVSVRAVITLRSMTSTTGNSASVYIGDVPEPKLETPLELAVIPGAPRVSVGITFAETDAAWAVGYDNVTIDLKDP